MAKGKKTILQESIVAGRNGPLYSISRIRMSCSSRWGIQMSLFLHPGHEGRIESGYWPSSESVVTADTGIEFSVHMLIEINRTPGNITRATLRRRKP